MGTATFSLEVELGWGLVQYDEMELLSERREAETETLSRLLDVCDRNGIAFSFDVVGHLLLDGPLESYDTPHEDGWFDPIPKGGPEQHPEFYARDLIEMIRDAEVDHEISTHTFSHIEMGSVSEAVVQWELEKVREVHESVGLPRPVSLVPPTHDPPPRQVVRRNGIRTLRVPQYQAPGVRSPPTEVHRVLDVLTGSHPIMAPVEREGVLESYSSLHLSIGSTFLPRGQGDPHIVWKMIPLPVRKWLHRRSLNRALTRCIEEDSYVHFWSHLHDIANEIQWPLVERFLDRVGRERRAGSLDVATMAELGERLRATR